jgi:DNA-binding transcriptional regulator YiaG
MRFHQAARRDMTMTPDELSRTLMRLDLTQTRLAALLGHDPRTVRSWVAGRYPVPKSAAIVLRLLARGLITIAQIEAAADKAVE